jgi:hypothetical protein
MARELGIPVYPVALGHHRIAERLKIYSEPDGQFPTGNPNEMQRLEMQQREIAVPTWESCRRPQFRPARLNPDTLRQILQFMVGQVRMSMWRVFTAPWTGKEITSRGAASRRTGKILGGQRSRCVEGLCGGRLAGRLMTLRRKFSILALFRATVEAAQQLVLAVEQGFGCSAGPAGLNPAPRRFLRDDLEDAGCLPGGDVGTPPGCREATIFRSSGLAFSSADSGTNPMSPPFGAEFGSSE